MRGRTSCTIIRRPTFLYPMTRTWTLLPANLHLLRKGLATPRIVWDVLVALMICNLPTLSLLDFHRVLLTVVGGLRHTITWGMEKNRDLKCRQA